MGVVKDRADLYPCEHSFCTFDFPATCRQEFSRSQKREFGAALCKGLLGREHPK